MPNYSISCEHKPYPIPPFPPHPSLPSPPVAPYPPQLPCSPPLSPMPSTCSSTLKTSTCAFSISSNNTTEYGRRLTASVSRPPCMQHHQGKAEAQEASYRGARRPQIAPRPCMHRSPLLALLIPTQIPPSLPHHPPRRIQRSRVAPPAAATRHASPCIHSCPAERGGGEEGRGGVFTGKNGGEEERGAEEGGKVAAGGEGGEGTSDYLLVKQQALTSRTMASSLLKR